MIMSVAMMLRHSLGLNAEAQAVEEAVTAAIEDGARTPDIAERGAKAFSTRQVADAVLGGLPKMATR
jgi:3-isopropylmalate dehydrogenase